MKTLVFRKDSGETQMTNQIQKHLKKHGVVSLSNLYRTLQLPPDSIRNHLETMLSDHTIRKLSPVNCNNEEYTYYYSAEQSPVIKGQDKSRWLLGIKNRMTGWFTRRNINASAVAGFNTKNKNED